jgi:hypothetical protein
MKINWKRLGTTIAILLLPVLLTRCLITGVTQPATVVKGTQVAVTVNGYDDNVPSNGAESDKGVLCVLVPNDWTLDSATYTAQEKGQATIYSGKLITAQNWKDSATATIAPPPGMKWIGMLSDSAYVYADTLFLSARLYLRAGQTTGTFPLGYLMTKNGADLIDEFSQGWSDTLMNQSITVQSATSVEEQSFGGLPTAYRLENNYPNPFNPSTTIRFALKDRGAIRLAVYDITGNRVALLAEGMREAGEYQVTFSPVQLASGVYFYRLEAGQFVQTHKMLLAK